MSQFYEEVTECLLAIKNDDHTQFERLLKLTHAPLLSLAKRYLMNNSFCDDVVSEVYTNIVKYAASFHPTDKNDGFRYLWSIVRNNAVDHNKDTLKHRAVNIEEVCVFDTKDQFERANLKMDISSALKKLDYKDAMIMVWTFEYGFTQEQIGELLGISKSAVSQRFTKSKEKMRNLLQR